MKLDRLTFEPNKPGGKACIRHQRISAATILHCLASGMSTAEVQQPCRRFRVHVSNGMRFDSDHPDKVALGLASLRINMPGPSTPEREARISLGHVIWIEVFLDESATPSGGLPCPKP
jgi:hypothetical protein